MYSKDKLEASLSTCTLKLVWFSSTNQLKQSGSLCYRMTVNFSQKPFLFSNSLDLGDCGAKQLTRLPCLVVYVKFQFVYITKSRFY